MEAAKFTDDAGREWVLRLDYTLVRQIRKTLGIDLIDLKGQAESFSKMDAEPQVIFDVLWEVVRPQCEQKRITIEDFGRGIGGEMFDTAYLALQEAAINFLQPRQREIARKTRAMTAGAMDKAMAMASEFLEKGMEAAQMPSMSGT